jgi:hypothetical protein
MRRRKRGRETETIDEVLKNPGQRFDVRPGRVVIREKKLDGLDDSRSVRSDRRRRCLRKK